MQILVELHEHDPSDEEAKAAYERAELCLEATGADLQELYAKNGEPLEQAKILYKAMAERD